MFFSYISTGANNLYTNSLNLSQKCLTIRYICLTIRNRPLYSFLTILFVLWLNSTIYFIMKTTNKKKLQKVLFNHSSDNIFDDFMKIYKKLRMNFIFSLNDTNLSLDNPFLRFRKNIKSKNIKTNRIKYKE